MWPWLAIFALAATVAAVLVARRRRPSLPVIPHRYDLPPHAERYSFRTRPRLPTVDRARPLLAAQSETWRAAMADAGARLRQAGVRRIVLVHGTFVGDDPTSLVEAMREYLHRLSPELEVALKLATRTGASRFLGDYANYSVEYAALLGDALGVPCQMLVWQSANHHAARLRGALELARAIAQAKLGRGRVLILGHSHGGQVLALLTQLAYPSTVRAQLLAHVRELGEDPAALEPAFAAVRRARLDLLTFGAPPRYGWVASPRYQLLHVVNHRGAEPRAGRLLGVLHTADGDYIQQWGVAGSDFPAGSARERELNARLDKLLGDGLDVKGWLANVRHRARVHSHGHTLLVDYGDQGAGLTPNFLQTLFGHGVYTSYEAMLFNAQLMATHLYPQKRTFDWWRRGRKKAKPAPSETPPARKAATR
jgi:hypothetical protein